MLSAMHDPAALAHRRTVLERDLADAIAELGQLKRSLDRYEKAIELPRVLQEIRRLEKEIGEIDRA